MPLNAQSTGHAPLRSAIRDQLALRDRRTRLSEIERLGETSWLILLELALSRIDDKRLSVTSACYASRAPATTALRHIAQLENAGHVHREPDPFDHRRDWLSIADDTFGEIEALFLEPVLARAA